MAEMNGTGKISDAAFMKRFIKSKEWFQWITGNILPEEIIHYQKPEKLEQYNVFAIDASGVNTKGAVKQSFHLHYSVDLFSLNCSQFKITEEKTGETLKNFIIQENDLIIADRAYATITSIEYCLENGGDFIFRIKNKPFNIYNEKQEKILLTDWPRTLDGDASETRIYFKDSNKNLCPYHFLKRSLQGKYLIFTGCAGRWNLYLKDTNPYWVLGVYQQKQKNLQRHG